MRNVQGKAALHKLGASLLRLVYQGQCPSCGLPSDNFGTFPLCTGCIDSISGYYGPSCRICAKPFASKYSDTCGDCLSDPPAFRRAYSFGLYEGVLMQSIHMMKFGGVRRLARPLADMLSSMELPGADAIVPVPATTRGLRARGFNQSALLAGVLSSQSEIPLRLDLLFKVRETPPQVGLSRKARVKNLRGAFEADASSTGMNIMLVDDVITTGATARECARALRKSGAGEVTAVSLARTY